MEAGGSRHGEDSDHGRIFDVIGTEMDLEDVVWALAVGLVEGPGCGLAVLVAVVLVLAASAGHQADVWVVGRRGIAVAASEAF